MGLFRLYLFRKSVNGTHPKLITMGNPRKYKLIHTLAMVNEVREGVALMKSFPRFYYTDGQESASMLFKMAKSSMAVTSTE